MKYRLGMVILHVQDFERSRSFYTNTLGLPIIPEYSNDHFVVVQPAGDAQIGITAAPDTTHGSSSIELAMEVSDVDSIYREWKAQGVTLLTEPANFPFGRAFDAQDPDGNRLSIFKVGAN